MINRTSVIAAGAVLVALGLTGCGSSDSDTTAEPATTTAASAPAGAGPGVDQLAATLSTFFNPAVPAADKVALVEDGTKQTAVLDQFNTVLQGYPLTSEVTKVVTVDADTATATVTLTGPHGGAPVELNFDEVNGTWVLSDEATCTVFGMGRLTCVE